MLYRKISTKVASAPPSLETILTENALVTDITVTPAPPYNLSLDMLSSFSFYFTQESDHEQKHSDRFGLALAIVRADGRELTPRGPRGGNPDLPRRTCPPRPPLP
jgi:hypothetical protein